MTLALLMVLAADGETLVQAARPKDTGATSVRGADARETPAVEGDAL
jgi:hypothetical protein